MSECKRTLTSDPELKTMILDPCLLRKSFTKFFKISVTSNLTAHVWRIKYR
jgi:hypothetical protein